MLQLPWAVDDQVDVRLVGTSRRFLGNIADVGTRSKAYRRVRPNGDHIDDTEWSLSHIESAVSPVLQNVIDRWPFSLDDKATLAEFIAVQILRGPRWWAQREDMVRSVAAEALADGVMGPDGVMHSASDVEVEATVRKLLGNTERDLDMLRLSRKLTSVICSMSWTLLAFDRDVLALSDHPVVIWPAGVSRWDRVGQFGRSAASIDAAEIRMPLGPRIALLLTWRDVPDDQDARKGELRFARSINEPMICQADRQWLARIGSRPMRGSGSIRPIAPSIWPGYGERSVYRSTVRGQVQRLLREEPPSAEVTAVNGEFKVVTARAA